MHRNKFFEERLFVALRVNFKTILKREADYIVGFILGLKEA